MQEAGGPPNFKVSGWTAIAALKGLPKAHRIDCALVASNCPLASGLPVGLVLWCSADFVDGQVSAVKLFFVAHAQAGGGFEYAIDHKTA
jgi:hypothetical protein